MNSSFYLFLTLFVTVGALVCTERYQCSSVTQHYDYVNCSDGQCVCLTDSGFAGNATTSGPCSCPSPATVYWLDSPYCIDIPTTTNAAARCNLLTQKVQTFYEYLLQPYSTLVLNGSLSIDNIISTSLQAEIDPLGFFNYSTIKGPYFGVADSPVSIATSVQFIDLFCSENKVFVNVIYDTVSLFTSPPTFLYNVTELGRFTFDDNNLVTKLHVVIPNLGRADASIGALDDPAAVIAGACEILVGNYVVTNGTCPYSPSNPNNYVNVTDCINFLSALPFGNPDQLAANTSNCRATWSYVTNNEPNFCSSAGKSGYPDCVDLEYGPAFYQCPYCPY